MSIQINNGKIEALIDKVLKKVPYEQTKVQFVCTAVDHYVKQLVKDKTIKLQ